MSTPQIFISYFRVHSVLSSFQIYNFYPQQREIRRISKYVVDNVSRPSGIAVLSCLVFSILQIIVSYRYCQILGCFQWEGKFNPHCSILAGSRDLLRLFLMCMYEYLLLGHII